MRTRLERLLTTVRRDGAPVRAAVLLVVAAGCSTDLADTEAAYGRWDGERVLCGVGVDGSAIPMAEIETAMRGAIERDEALILFGHQPGTTISHARIAAIVETAQQLDLPFLTFPELADPAHARAGIALGFDDAYVDDWYAIRDVLSAARVTFFVSSFGDLTAGDRDHLHALAADGHAIEAHGMGHRDAPEYVDRHGLAAYLAAEIDPLLVAMAAEGFHPTTFAYPFGDRTREIDDALLTRFSVLRSLTYLDRSVLNEAPCPQ